jgi:hypothetical protein
MINRFMTPVVVIPAHTCHDMRDPVALAVGAIALALLTARGVA